MLGGVAIYAVFGIDKISKADFVGLCAVFFLLIIKLTIDDDLILWLADARYFFSFLVFALYFKCRSEKEENEELIKALNILFYTSVILLLTEYYTSEFLDWQWPNQPSDTRPSGRAVGFGGNSTVTAVLLIALAHYLRKSVIWDLIVLAFTLSATGVVVFVIKLIFTRNFIGVGFLAAVSLMWLLAPHGVEGYRISPEYFAVVYEIKAWQIEELLMKNHFSWLMGVSHFETVRSGDFAFLDFLSYAGLVGLGVFSVVVYNNIRSGNAFLIIALLIGSLHYGVIFSMPGSILMGYFMSLYVSPCRSPLQNKVKCGNL